MKSVFFFYENFWIRLCGQRVVIKFILWRGGLCVYTLYWCSSVSFKRYGLYLLKIFMYLRNNSFIMSLKALTSICVDLMIDRERMGLSDHWPLSWTPCVMANSRNWPLEFVKIDPCIMIIKKRLTLFHLNHIKYCRYGKKTLIF